MYRASLEMQRQRSARFLNLQIKFLYLLLHDQAGSFVSFTPLAERDVQLWDIIPNVLYGGLFYNPYQAIDLGDMK